LIEKSKSRQLTGFFIEILDLNIKILKQTIDI